MKLKVYFGYCIQFFHQNRVWKVWSAQTSCTSNLTSVGLTQARRNNHEWIHVIIVRGGGGFGGWGAITIHYQSTTPNPSWIHTIPQKTHKFPAIPEKLQSRKEFQTLTQLAQPPNASNYQGQSVILVWPTKVLFRSNISKKKDKSATTLLSTHTHPY